MKKLLALFLVALVLFLAVPVSFSQASHLGPIYSPSINGADISLLAFGAKCDGSTNDASALNAAITAAAVHGGTIIVPASASGCLINSTITISQDKIGLRGASWMYGNTAPSQLIFAAATSGLVVTGNAVDIEDLGIISKSTTSGSDVGVLLEGGRPFLKRVVSESFGGACFVMDSTTGNVDHWIIEQSAALNCKGNGFWWKAGSDNNVGVGIGLDATSNGGVGFQMDAGNANVLLQPHASANVGGDYNQSAGQGWNYINPYCESGTGSSFTFGSSTSWNRVSFTNFGLCTTVTNSGASGFSNSIEMQRASLPTRGMFTVGPDDPSAASPQYYTHWVTGGNYQIDWAGNFNILKFNAGTQRWDVPRQLNLTLAIGTAPLVVTSTTPVANLTLSNHPQLEDCGATATCAQTKETAALVIRGSLAFPTATTVTLSSLPFTSSSSYSCTASDTTTAAGIVNATTYTSGSSVTFTETTGTTTDSFRYICAGF